MAHDPLAQARGTCVQAPTTNLSSNDPWRDTESPQAPETSRRLLECEKPRGAEGDPGKQRETDCWGRWHKKPDTTTKAEPDLRTGPARTRKTSSQDLDTQTRETGRTPTRHPDHARSGNAGACQTGPRTRMGSEVCTPQLWIQTRTLMPRRHRTNIRCHQQTTPICAARRYGQLVRQDKSSRASGQDQHQPPLRPTYQGVAQSGGGRPGHFYANR